MRATEEKIFDYIRWKLGVPQSSSLVQPETLHGFSIDLIQADTDGDFLIEINSRSSIDSLARLNLARDIYVKELGSKKKVTPVLVTQTISSALYDKAKGLGIVIIEVPKGMLQDNRVSTTKRSIKISSEKSWLVVSKLLQLNRSTINRLSKETKVSYGWTHATIEYLLRQNIAIRQGDIVQINDMDKLLSGIAWERSTLDLITTEFPLGPGETFGLAREIAENLEKNDIGCAFACYLPGTLYTGYATRFDSIQIYMDHSHVEFLRDRFQGEGGKVRIQVLEPDRDVLRMARIIDDVPITSPSQTLLDLAGLGFRAKDMTKVLVERYANL